MSWQDRPYSGDDYGSQVRIQFFPRPTTAVMYLVIANVVIFFLHHGLVGSGRLGGDWFAQLFGLSLVGIQHGYLWQVITYMFVHAGVSHIFFNMLMLYFVGIEFERTFGRERFLKFYALCGVFGGLAYLGLSLIWPGERGIPLVGASGAIYGILVAAMIFFPSMKLILVFFPVPIRVFGLIMIGTWVLMLLRPSSTENFGGELCHAAGAATGLIVCYAWGMMPKIRFNTGRLGKRLQEGAWARKQRALADEQAEVDRILEKIHVEGLNSLTRGERKILAEATRQQREREQELDRMDRL